MTRWEALVRYDPEIREAALQLLPFGSVWVDRLGEAFTVLNEDRKYLSNIVTELLKEAEHLEARAWLQKFSKTQSGDDTSEEAMAVLIEAQTEGYRLIKEEDGTIKASRDDLGTTSLRSNADILRFSQWAFKSTGPTAD
jgi:hypothetical protein